MLIICLILRFLLFIVIEMWIDRPINLLLTDFYPTIYNVKNLDWSLHFHNRKRLKQMDALLRQYNFVIIYQRTFLWFH
jgi:hypothetical protein